MVNESVAMAEELVSEYYKMSASEWLRPKFDVKTRIDLSSDEIVPGPFAQVVRYEGRLKKPHWDLPRMIIIKSVCRIMKFWRH